ncbi:AraC family transcriptional regulator [Pedobacter frigidisoli]|uniref:AraC family transcriptional regulator n=1 Tax=Pedobacter frigidisoli TaxID=2530455 RepID=A0A4R0P5Z9_9SPHI|nr:AraC family transcriptional regulator [Pedobacter frigidisoli]TCD10830.1 AraC family transcriptional regulator [Pedobacter frigidisoli]
MPNQLKRPNILYSCYSQKSSEGEQFIPDHVFGYMISGTSENYIGDEKYVFKEGDFRLFRRNQLTKYTKYPPPGGIYKSISIVLDQETLRKVSEEYGLTAKVNSQTAKAMLLEPNKLFQNYMESIRPYLEDTNEFNKLLTNLKVREAIMILLETNPALKDILFDFSEPGKIDLEAYMNKHYKFNVDLKRFAYLTGRSLATFKRDFDKVFGLSPNKWLQKKRLADAHYLIKEKGWRSSDVYMEVGFKDFSHFSFAFKKAYGIAPSKLIA